MTSTLIPSDPSSVMVIRKVTDNIVTFSTPFARMGRIKIGGRGTAVRMSSGGVAVFSPTALTDDVRESITSLGEVKYISALDIEHHIFLGPWHQAYPNAKILAPEGLPEKRTKQKNEEVRFDFVFTAQNKDSLRVGEEFDKDFDYEYVPGHVNKELVFNFKPEKTMIQGDLIFNLPAVEQYSKSSEDPHTGPFTKFFTSINNTSGPNPWQRRLIWHAIAADRASYNKSIGKIDQWEFDRMIPCHGDVIETGAKGVFRKVMQWHLDGLQKQ